MSTYTTEKDSQRKLALLTLASQYKVLNKSGAWYSFGETRLGQGRDNVRQFLRGNLEMYAEIESKIGKVYHR